MSCTKVSWAAFYAVAVEILRGLGFVPTAVNVKLLGSWMYAEHGTVGTGTGANPWNCDDATGQPAYNPLDVVGPVLFGAHPINCLDGGSIEPPCAGGVLAYTSAAQGVRATVSFLRTSRAAAPIVAALRVNNPSAFFAPVAHWGALAGGNGTTYSQGLATLYAQLPVVPARVLASGGASHRKSKSLPGKKLTPSPIPGIAGVSPWVWVSLGAGVVGLGILGGVVWHRRSPSFSARTRSWLQSRPERGE